MDRPTLCVMLLTYDRLECAEITLRSALDNITYDGSLNVHIADDGTSDDYREQLTQLAGGYAAVQAVGSTDADRGGYGRNYNLATQKVHRHSQIVLPLEDDWRLLRPLDLNPLVDALLEDQFGCIRLGYLGYTQSLRGEVVSAANRLWLAFDPGSHEPHVFAGHPRLETVEWEKKVGPWPEGLDPNMTEFSVCHIPEARQGVVWPIGLVLTHGDLFAHIGADRVGRTPEGDHEMAVAKEAL